MTAATPAPAAAEPHAWASVRSWWHVAFAAATAVSAALVVLGPGTRAARGGALAVLAALVVVYLVTGRRLVDPSAPDSVAALYRYAVPAVVLLAAGLLLSPGLFSMLFVLPAQLFAGAPTFRWAVPAVGALLVAGAVGQARWVDPPFTRAAWTQSIGQFAVIGMFSFGMGAFIMRIVVQSAERAALIEELTRTRADLAAVQREAGVQAERQRLAHDIHDTLAQGFTSIVVLAQAARVGVGEEHPAHRPLAAIEDTARHNLAEARALVADLTPPALASGSLAAAGRRLVDQLAREVGIDATWEVRGDPRALPADVEVVLLRALQEALANVRRHAAAHTVRAALDYGPDRVVLTVADDGVGFVPDDGGAADGAAPGYGLRGMRARLDQVGGSLTVVAAPDRGTELRAEVEAP